MTSNSLNLCVSAPTLSEQETLIKTNFYDEVKNNCLHHEDYYFAFNLTETIPRVKRVAITSKSKDIFEILPA